MNCPIEIYIDGNHKLEAVATDGVNIEPVEYGDVLVVSGGERSVFMLSSNTFPQHKLRSFNIY